MSDLTVDEKLREIAEALQGEAVLVPVWETWLRASGLPPADVAVALNELRPTVPLWVEHVAQQIGVVLTDAEVDEVHAYATRVTPGAWARKILPTLNGLDAPAFFGKHGASGGG